MLFSIPLLDIDLGDAHVIEYRAEIYKQGRYFVATFMAFFIICGAIVSFRTIRAIKEQKKKVLWFKSLICFFEVLSIWYFNN